MSKLMEDGWGSPPNDKEVEFWVAMRVEQETNWGLNFLCACLT